ncbi:TetR/AcrR family transcriptional regulator [Rhizosphaericola mali]|uniref:TetR/AcrR family transcriptional regulator n=1 Tax=Rhizosphaericola mali TaxID=2545455 RepID=A0A5P2G6R0_9BACT|nr:TetR family transcriptional regulator [Rhizosphaericola mali]QES89622.1 TetR/AcrR family transcriptional regulator [Rhizosphaericola mali]
MDKKSQIIASATELFARKGFEGTSIRDIASQAGVNLAMINYYFGSKEKLFEAVMVSDSEYMLAIYKELADRQDMLTIDKVYAVIDYHVEKLMRKREFHKLLHHEIMLNQRMEVSDIIRDIIKKNKTLLSQIVNDGIIKGEFRQVDVALTMSLIFGTINQLFLSKTICNVVLDNNDCTKDPFTPELKDRVVVFMKDVMQRILLK